MSSGVIRDHRMNLENYEPTFDAAEEKVKRTFIRLLLNKI
jgi:hypothetical protein